MNTEFIMLGLLLAVVVGVLALGLFSMARGGAFAQKYGNRLMRARIGLQLVAVLLLVLVAWLKSR